MPPAKRQLAPLGWLQPGILVGSFTPFAVLVYRVATHRLGANPIATALNQLGLLALVFLLACLACTPLQAVLGANWPIRLRKTLGLFAFFTALLHFLVYLVLDQSFRVPSVLRDVVKRPVSSCGFTALVLLVPLALTSTKRSLQRLGFARWKRLHRLVYVVGVLGVVHYYMRVKADTREPLAYGAVLALLFAVRVVEAWRSKPKKRPQKGAAALG